jgi:hypothetical protein
MGVRRLDDAELIAIRIAENVPAPAVLLGRLAGEQAGPDAHHAPYLGIKILCAQVEVQPVLAVLALSKLE